ncbi:RNA polymerase sigma factor SigZ [Pleionea sp. CnH1-48]|uniref:RNA polymerase sigma factor SigZ n=1 Tax=Pleionea sp. CnH1-48 TaxID=2954494 RepID=UPI002096D7D2|nr:RNA polymerase sigma factor SigZ [Pleionea sp. CnH1-48]MCO7225126.1 RNA polymerase sigma factor SigZ [Pleionea sp. CnH1-48]
MSIEHIWNNYRVALKSFIARRVSNPTDVDDIFQDILIKSYSKLETLDSEKSLKPWLFKIASNTLIDFYRKDKPVYESDVDNLFDEDIEDIKAELSDCIVPFINSLPEENAKLLMAIDINHLSQKEYAEEIGVSYSTLKSRVQKSRSMLKQAFDDCCHFSHDAQGNLMDYERRAKQRKRCD